MHHTHQVHPKKTYQLTINLHIFDQFDSMSLHYSIYCSYIIEIGLHNYLIWSLMFFLCQNQPLKNFQSWKNNQYCHSFIIIHTEVISVLNHLYICIKKC